MKQEVSDIRPKNKIGISHASQQPAKILTRSLNRGEAGRPSEPPVSRANSAQIEQLRLCLIIADSGEANLVQKLPATPSDDEKAKQPHKLRVSLADDKELNQAHGPSATDAGDKKKHRTLEALQARRQEDAKVTALNASLLERVNTYKLVSVEPAPKPFLPERPALLGLKTIIQGGSIGEPIVIDASDDEHEKEDLDDSEHRNRFLALCRVRSRAQQADGVVL
ncbi:hypothetical protein CC86DRAFT_383021 [Ophiobolus disseminans]|uniref:Uncharacterized protein n=1 Tax=Ophiobolus disseminans TaxID=1469910 RepID=A0A6A6ZZX7_9PLEO|nr:hypothetical protein CC86DRAFT_383021 [Ophiobolus disseminans]